MITLFVVGPGLIFSPFDGVVYVVLAGTFGDAGFHTLENGRKISPLTREGVNRAVATVTGNHDSRIHRREPVKNPQPTVQIHPGVGKIRSEERRVGKRRGAG